MTRYRRPRLWVEVHDASICDCPHSDEPLEVVINLTGLHRIILSGHVIIHPDLDEDRD